MATVASGDCGGSLASGADEPRTWASYQMARAVRPGRRCAARAYENQKFCFCGSQQHQGAGVDGARSRGGLGTEGWAYCSCSHVGLNREEEERLTRECGKFREGKRRTEGVERRGDEQRHVQAPGPILGVKGNSQQQSHWV